MDIAQSNIIFFSVVGLLSLILLAVAFLIIRAIVLFVLAVFKNIFKKPQVDYGEDLEVVVEGLEESKKQREDIQGKIQSITPEPKIKIAEPVLQKMNETTDKNAEPEELPVPVSPHAKKSYSPEKVQKMQEEVLGAAVFSEQKEPIRQAPTATLPAKDLTPQNQPVAKQEPQRQNPASSKKEDFSFFMGKSEQSRRALKHELGLLQGEAGQEVYKAQRAAGLSMTRTEREGLVEKYFPKHYGQSISKDEMRKQLNIMQKKAFSNPSERMKVMKEIKFLKKLGGIK